MLAPIKERVKGMSAEEAGKQLSCDESETEFHERFQILMRMHTDPEYTQQVLANFKPSYIAKNH
jgi:hypothetical protein